MFQRWGGEEGGADILLLESQSSAAVPSVCCRGPLKSDVLDSSKTSAAQNNPASSERPVSLLLNPGAEACLRMLTLLTPLTLLSRTGSDGDSDLPIKQCPMCGIYIERNQGCAQMLCKSCKHTFCWYCLQNLDVSVPPPSEPPQSPFLDLQRWVSFLAPP